MSDYVVMLSGGVTSFEALRRTLQKSQSVIALFADVKGDNDPIGNIAGEDDDAYRFLNDIDRVLWPVTRIKDGRGIWELFNDRNFIGNTRVDVCSRTLKRDLCRKWMKQNEPSATVVFGLDWTELHRVENVGKRWLADGFKTEFPLCDKPYLLKPEYFAIVKEFGIEPPRLYLEGFEHNNCGGACVKGGQGQWARLLQTNPKRYLYNEREERKFRERTGKDVAMLRDFTGGSVKPLTLEALRQRIESGQKAQDDLFSCNCFSEPDETEGNPALATSGTAAKRLGSGEP